MFLLKILPFLSGCGSKLKEINFHLDLQCHFFSRAHFDMEKILIKRLHFTLTVACLNLMVVVLQRLFSTMGRYTIVSTGGTASALETAGISVTKVEEINEILMVV